jgi:voltage-gated potassium channel Kch
MQMLARGATQVVPEVQEAGLQLAHLVLEHSGMSADAARELVELRRAELAIEPKR